MLKVKNCVLRNQTYHARLAVPHDLRELVGKREITQSLKTGDPFKAEKLASSVLLKWKHTFQQMRLSPKEARPDLSRDSILQSLREDWEATYNSSAMNDHEREAHILAVEDYADQLGVSRDESLYIQGLKESFQNHIEPFLSQLRLEGQKEKSIDEFKTICRRFSAKFSYTDEVNSQALRSYLSALPGRTTGSTASITQQNKVKTRLSRFFQFCGATAASETLRQIKFHTKKIKKQNKASFFSDSEVNELFSASQNLKHRGQTLLQLCQLAAYSGARIEELCNLKHDDVCLSDMTLKIRGTKTENADRIIPIHHRLEVPILEMLNKHDGFLLDGLSHDSYGQRSGAIGKQFGRLKKSLGYGPQHRFHSFRTTFIQKLRNLGCPEHISASIADQANPNITYGHYGDAITTEVIETMRAWVDLVKYEDRHN